MCLSHTHILISSCRVTFTPAAIWLTLTFFPLLPLGVCFKKNETSLRKVYIGMLFVHIQLHESAYFSSVHITVCDGLCMSARLGRSTRCLVQHYPGCSWRVSGWDSRLQWKTVIKQTALPAWVGLAQWVERRENKRVTFPEQEVIMIKSKQN